MQRAWQVGRAAEIPAKPPPPMMTFFRWTSSACVRMRGRELEMVVIG